MNTERNISPLEARLLNDYQRDFPLTPQPFARIAEQLETQAATVITCLQKLQQQGAVSRVGPVFRPNRIGASTLAALSAPGAELERVAGIVSARPEVNHNYEREHTFNLWFVVTAEDQERLQAVLDSIGRDTGYKPISLPLVKEYHIDLGFGLGGNAGRGRMQYAPTSDISGRGVLHTPSLDDPLIEAIQSGLPLVERPYLEIGKQVGMAEQEVIQCIAEMQAAGVIKRLGVVVRHHELGYRANAMLVWDVPDALVDEVGQRLSGVDCVTLCYQRPRVLPVWPYNLFTMIHGKDRHEVLACIDDIAAKLELGDIPRHVLFSTRRFKQCGARYRGD
ncbi:MAG: Lrp/AsnC family transcriptional regulator [Gammaproteobacteria bacterium]|nr:Lrp/AsnC family transcriptional regulator [Gammaproteobacteria bacterium]MBU1723953.1 Lrp/AsnC family transcriptional regulator [Gammaproteobacteria bacterium]MBU2007146.1 Lrp/AsnC family transcriptional regulator [Gammaproteobacteria bacterium]